MKQLWGTSKWEINNKALKKGGYILMSCISSTLKVLKNVWLGVTQATSIFFVNVAIYSLGSLVIFLKRNLECNWMWMLVRLKIIWGSPSEMDCRFSLTKQRPLHCSITKKTGLGEYHPPVLMNHVLKLQIARYSFIHAPETGPICQKKPPAYRDGGVAISVVDQWVFFCSP